MFRELTDQRVQVPWIDAFRKKEKYGQEATRPSGKPETPIDRDLTPKKMSDSYHSVVRPPLAKPGILSLTDNVAIDSTSWP